MDIILGNGDISLSAGEMRDSGYPCFLMIRGDQGEIGRFDDRYKNGSEVNEEDCLVRIIFTKKESLKVFQEQFAEVKWKD